MKCFSSVKYPNFQLFGFALLGPSHKCPAEEKGCSARDLVIKYVMIGEILTELQIPEHTAAGTNTNRKMPNYLLLIDIYGENP